MTYGCAPLSMYIILYAELPISGTILLPILVPNQKHFLSSTPNRLEITGEVAKVD